MTSPVRARSRFSPSADDTQTEAAGALFFLQSFPSRHKAPFSIPDTPAPRRQDASVEILHPLRSPEAASWQPARLPACRFHTEVAPRSAFRRFPILCFSSFPPFRGAAKLSLLRNTRRSASPFHASSSRILPNISTSSAIRHASAFSSSPGCA